MVNGLSYDYLLTKWLKYFKVECVGRVAGTTKQMFIMTMLIEIKVWKGRLGPRPKCLNYLSGKLEEMRVEVATYDVEITQLKARVQKLATEVPGTSDELKAENIELKTQFTALTDEVLGLQAEVKDLTK